MPNWPLVYKTYQDVKNNLIYWTVILLIPTTIIIYFLFLNQSQQTLISDLITNIGANSLLATLASAICIASYSFLAFVLIYGMQIHDLVYDKYIIKWRERYDTEFILPRLTEPFKDDLPKNFSDYAKHYRYKFMGPYYDFVGDLKGGIEENTRIRFYERVTWYWITQLNEIFILVFLITTPVFVLFTSGANFNLHRFAIFMLILITLGLFNRWLVRRSLMATTEATQDEINEILAKPKNVKTLRQRFIKLCKENKL